MSTLIKEVYSLLFLLLNPFSWPRSCSLHFISAFSHVENSKFLFVVSGNKRKCRKGLRSALKLRHIAPSSSSRSISLSCGNQMKHLNCQQQPTNDAVLQITTSVPLPKSIQIKARTSSEYVSISPCQSQFHPRVNLIHFWSGKARFEKFTIHKVPQCAAQKFKKTENYSIPLFLPDAIDQTGGCNKTVSQ